MAKLQNRIAYVLAQRNETPTQLATSVGIGPQHLNQIIHGLVAPRITTAIRIASCLNRSLEDLFWIEEA